MKVKRKIAWATLLVILSVFLAVALISHDQRDWGSFWRVNNLCGPVGAALSGAVRFLLGPVFSWFVPLFLMYWGVTLIGGRRLWDERKLILCSFIILLLLVSIVSAFEWDGGVIGDKTSGFLALVSGRVGSLLLLFGGLLVTTTVLFLGSVRSVMRRIGRLIDTLPGRLRAVKIVEGRTTKKSGRKGKKPVKVSKTVKAEEGEETLRIAEPEPRQPKIEQKPASTLPVQPAGVSSGAENAPLPDIAMLDSHDGKAVSYSRDDLVERSKVIESKLRDYGIDGKVQEVRPGPVVTTFEFVPASGVKVSQIASRVDDISLALAARAIRIQAPIPGRGAVGIEVPNPNPETVSLKEILEHYPYERDGLIVGLGKTVTGEPFFADIADMPHLLIAGATGSGKSVSINVIICSLLFHHTPATCRFILIDPKRLELVSYKGIPHLLHPVITDAKSTFKVLNWLTQEMDRRYTVLASVGVKNIRSFNRKVEEEEVISPVTGEPLERLPYYVTIIDELADIMTLMGNEIYAPITRLSQMARAVGIHLVFATQRPSVDVVTGLIKANFPCRIAFQVISKTDSRTILDANGAEKLLGNGDMLYMPKDQPTLIRVQGAFISEGEAERVAGYWKAFQGGKDEIDLSDRGRGGIEGESDIDDELFNTAKELVIMHQQGSISLLQRRLRIGYARAARLIDMLEQSGVVGPFEGSKARRVLIKREEYEGI